MPITPPPEAPSPDDLDNFDDEAAAWVAYWELASAELTALEANVVGLAAGVAETATEFSSTLLVAADAAGFVARSTSTLVVGPGVKTITFTEAKPKFGNDYVVIVSRTNPWIKMLGASTFDGSTHMSVTVVSDGVVPPDASGSFSSWLIISGAFFGSGATAADILAAVSDALSVTPKAMKDALTPYALMDGPTVTPNGLLGLDFTWPIGGNRTLAPITNTYPGAGGRIRITQDATGSRILATGGSGVWKRPGGLGALTTTAGAVDTLRYDVIAVDGSGTATLIEYEISRNPTT